MVIRALQKIFQNPAYVLLAFVISASVFAFAVWLPNIPLIVKVTVHPGVPLLQKVALPVSLLGSITTNFSLLSASYTVAIAILFGLNLAMVVYAVRSKVASVNQSGIAAGFLGIGSGVVGVGCAACGSFILTSILSTLGGAGILALLPFRGGEFGIIGVIALAYALYLLSRRINRSPMCESN